MQIEDLLIKNSTEKRTDRVSEFFKEDKTSDGGAKLVGTQDPESGVKVEKGSVTFHSPVYDKKEIKTAAEAYEKQAQSGAGEKNLRNEMILAAHTMSKEDFRQMQENGFDPADTDQTTFVTIADKIRIVMAKAGKDMSITGKVSKAAIEAVSGSAAEASSIESAVKQSSGVSGSDPQSVADQTMESLQQADLPVGEDTASQVKDLAARAAGLPDRIDADTAVYLIKNGQEPRVDNVLKAAYAGNTDQSQAASLSDEDAAQLLPQIEKLIGQAGYRADESSRADALFLLKNKVPLTPENIKLFTELKGKETIRLSDIPQAVTDAVKEGRSVSETMAVSGFSAMDMAREAVEVISAATDKDAASVVSEGKPLTIASLRAVMGAGSTGQPGSGAASAADTAMALKEVTAKRQLEETRLYMTTEANFTLIKQGISLDTTELSEIVERLKDQEKSLGQLLFPGEAELADIFDDAQEAISQAKDAPAAVLTSYPRVDGIFSDTLTGIAETGRSLSFKKAEGLYEKLMTSPDRRYGDSIEKAFANIDEVLAENGIEVDEENRRAVRILSYNDREVTAGSVQEVRAADEKVQRVFGNLTPGVVMRMVKQGENPLSLSMDELYDKTVEIRRVLSSSGSAADKEASDYADFLWRAQQSGKLTDEEQQSYIGLYRLMHQIDVTDGAPIGALLFQGAEITMENLMMALRTRKAEGSDELIGDDYQSPKSQITNSITDQIGAAFAGRGQLSASQEAQRDFQTQRTRDAKALATPEKLQSIGGEKAYLPMSPDQLASALEALSGQSTGETDTRLYEQKQREIEQAIEQASDESYQILSDAGVSDSALNLSAINQVLKTHRFFYTKLYGESGRQPFDVIAESMGDGSGLTLDDGWEKLISDFAEAMETPEELAKAQQELYETAENVLRRSLADDAAEGRIDVRLIQQSVRQLAVMKELSQRKEEYAIPVMVGDELGNMNLKIVRAKDGQKGLIDIAIDSDTTGEIYARFRAASDGGIDGKITTSRRESRETLSENLSILASAIHEKLPDGSVSLVTEYDGRTDATAVFTDTADPGFETTDERTDEIQTRILYGIARSFVETVGELFQ